MEGLGELRAVGALGCAGGADLGVGEGGGGGQGGLSKPLLTSQWHARRSGLAAQGA